MNGAYVYVVTIEGQDRPVKIGFSANLTGRIHHLSMSSGRKHRLRFARVSDYPRLAEKEAHVSLWENKLFGEWFAVDKETAISAVSAAVEMFLDFRGGPNCRPVQWDKDCKERIKQALKNGRPRKQGATA